MAELRDNSELVRELVSTKCRCGAKKSNRKTFCPKCYFSLPRKLQDELYNEVGNGYAEAYQRSEEILTEKGRFRVAGA